MAIDKKGNDLPPSYISRINDFWKLHSEAPFELSDIAIYFTLLHLCNSLNWKNPFGHSDRHLSAQMNCGVNTLRRSKERLAERKLIKFEAGGFKGQTLYTLLSVSNLNTLSVSNLNTDRTTVYPNNEQGCIQNGYGLEQKNDQKMNKGVSNLDNNIREEKTRKEKIFSLNENQKNSFELLFPKSLKDHYQFNKFYVAWNKLLRCKKWENKTKDQLQIALDSFKGYEPGYVAEKIINVIQNDWPMVKVSVEDFQDWCSQNNREPYDPFRKNIPGARRGRSGNPFEPLQEFTKEDTIFQDCDKLLSRFFSNHEWHETVLQAYPKLINIESVKIKINEFCTELKNKDRYPIVLNTAIHSFYNYVVSGQATPQSFMVKRPEPKEQFFYEDCPTIDGPPSKPKQEFVGEYSEYIK